MTGESNLDMSREIAAVARTIARQFPELAPVRLKYLGAGMDSVAFTVNETWIFRFPMRASVERQLLVERAVLPVIAPRLSIPIPLFRFVGRPDEDFPMHFAGYEMLSGTSAVDVPAVRTGFDAIAAQLGPFLSAIHAFPRPQAERLGAGTHLLEENFDEVRASALALVHRVREVAGAGVVEQLRRYLEDLRPMPLAPWPLTLTHNDLAAEHVLLDETGSRVTGVIDWGDVSIADPTVDFVGLFAWGGDRFVRSVLSSYRGPVTELVLERVRPWAAFRAVQDIEFGLNRQLPDVVTLGLRALESELGENAK